MTYGVVIGMIDNMNITLLLGVTPIETLNLAGFFVQGLRFELVSLKERCVRASSSNSC